MCVVIATMTAVEPVLTTHSPAIDVDDGHVLLRIDEAAQVLRIGRSLAYKLAHEYLNTDGAGGLPVLRFGTCLRVPRWALDELAATGRVVRLSGVQAPRPS